jgi:hypothetical protein
MRSEILGFNAPIKQKGGLYYYDDPYYSILSISFTDSGLLKKILETLIRIRPEVNHPELEILIEKLTGLSGIKPSTEILDIPGLPHQDSLAESAKSQQNSQNGSSFRSGQRGREEDGRSCSVDSRGLCIMLG